MAAGAAWWIAVIGGCRPTPPATPVFISVTDTVYRRAGAVFSLTTTAPGDRDVAYVLDWGDGQVDTTLNWRSGDTAEVRHLWQNAGQYQVRAMAVLFGETGRASGWTGPVTITVLDNGIPAVPEFTMPERVVPHGVALFRATTTDPDGDSVSFCFDFGDAVGGWTSFVASGGTRLDSHRYARLETVEVRCKAKDKKGSESDWSEPKALVVDRGGSVLWWWSPPRGVAPFTSPVIVLDGTQETVYVPTYGGYMYGVGLDGQTRRSCSVGPMLEYSLCHPAFCTSTGHIVVGYEERELYAFTPSLGKVWRWPGPGSAGMRAYFGWGPMAIASSRVYAPSENDSLYCFADLGLTVRREAAYDIPGMVDAPVIDAGGYVYIGTDSGYLYKMPPDLAGPTWQKMLRQNDEIHSPAIGADGTIYCGSRSGRVFAVDPSDGSMKWTTLLEGEAHRVVVSSTALFVGTGSGKLYCLNPTDGASNWVMQYGDAGITTSAILAGEYLFYHDREDVVYCLRQSDGGLVWSCRCSDYGPPVKSSRAGRQWEFDGNPTILSNGNIIVIGQDAMYCVAGCKDKPLMNAPWPKWQHDLYNTGKAGK